MVWCDDHVTLRYLYSLYIYSWTRTDLSIIRAHNTYYITLKGRMVSRKSNIISKHLAQTQRDHIHNCVALSDKPWLYVQEVSGEAHLKLFVQNENCTFQRQHTENFRVGGFMSAFPRVYIYNNNNIMSQRVSQWLKNMWPHCNPIIIILWEFSPSYIISWVLCKSVIYIYLIIHSISSSTNIKIYSLPPTFSISLGRSLNLYQSQ